MADNMIERVAMEIYASTWKPGSKADMEKVEVARKQARAAVNAMRVPSNKMVQCGSGKITYEHSLVDSDDQDAMICWQAMIDAALNEDGND